MPGVTPACRKRGSLSSQSRPFTAGTRSKRGRSVSVHTEEKLLQELRVRQGSHEGRATLRERVGVEHDLSHIGHWQGDRARYCGARKNLLDLRRCAVVNNLHIFVRQPEIMAQTT